MVLGTPGAFVRTWSIMNVPRTGTSYDLPGSSYGVAGSRYRNRQSHNMPTCQQRADKVQHFDSVRVQQQQPTPAFVLPIRHIRYMHNARATSAGCEPLRTALKVKMQLQIKLQIKIYQGIYTTNSCCQITRIRRCTSSVRTPSPTLAKILNINILSSQTHSRG